MKPQVSVVIPVYNAQDYIETTISSVLSQSFQDFEVVIVDDCSKDQTYELCTQLSKHHDRIKLYKTAKHFGCPGGPRNLGVRHSSGKWIAFLDADDIWHKNKLSIQLDVLSNSGLYFCSSELFRFRNPNEFNTCSSVKTYMVEEVTFISQMFNYQTPTSSVVVKKEIMEKEPFREEISFKAREDTDCWLRIHKRIGKSIKVKEKLLGYRLVSSQISGNKLLMIGRTFHCYNNSLALTNKYLGILPAVLTLTHFSRAIINKIFSRSI